MGKLHVDKVAVVTGAARGIGYAIAEEILKEGGKVALLDLLENEVKDSVRKLTEKYGEGRAIGFICDVSDEQRIVDVFAQVNEKYGKIDYLVNNAGITGPFKPFYEYTTDEYQKVLDVDLLGVFLCAREAVKYMPEGESAMVNISSAVGVVGTAMAVGYVTAKHGVVGLTKSSALDLVDKGIRVNAISPGVIITEMMEDAAREAANGDVDEGMKIYVGRNPMKRAGQPEEIATTTSFLLSNKSKYLNGQTIRIDGVQTMTF